MKVPGHLLIEEVKLAAGQEWSDATSAWRFVRLGGGTAYWLGRNLTRPLAKGEVVVVPPRGSGAVRASQLNDAVVHSFIFSPERLCGFLTLTERHLVETRAASSAEARFLPSTHLVSQRFSAIVAEAPPRSALPRRAQVLGVVALHFAQDFARHRVPTKRSASALQRFKQIVETMPDSEIINLSSDELALRCGYSPRHFSRLFQNHFHVSVRARQTELRLLKARLLLAETDSKIGHVALESGSPNLGRFNGLFKERFGLSPEAWRQQCAPDGTRPANLEL